MTVEIAGEKLLAIKQWLGTGSINIFGMPFSGKDTQCERLANLLDAATFGGGDILRNSKVPAATAEALRVGELVPQDEFLAMILPHFKSDYFVGKPLVLSSVGRWKGEENSVFQAAEQSGHPIKVAICLELSHDEAIARLQTADRSRSDDETHILETRFEEFSQKTEPVLDAYKKAGLLVSVDGDQSFDAVTQTIIDALYEQSQKKV
jgi:adenylate kinase